MLIAFNLLTLTSNLYSIIPRRNNSTFLHPTAFAVFFRKLLELLDQLFCCPGFEWSCVGTQIGSMFRQGVVDSVVPDDGIVWAFKYTYVLNRLLLTFRGFCAARWYSRLWERPLDVLIWARGPGFAIGSSMFWLQWNIPFQHNWNFSMNLRNLVAWQMNWRRRVCHMARVSSCKILVIYQKGCWKQKVSKQ